MSVVPLAPVAGALHPTGPGRRALSRSPRRAARRWALALLALLAGPSSAWALDAREVLRYDLHLGLGGDVKAAVAGDGNVLLAWRTVKPVHPWGVIRAQWLAPDGTPLGDPFVALRGDAGLRAVAARPGRRGLIVSSTRGWVSAPDLTMVGAGGVVGRANGEALDFAWGAADVTATGNGYFLRCGPTGWWLSETGRPRQRVDLATNGDLALAGGPGRSVVAVYEAYSRLRARWMTPSRQGPEMELDAHSTWPFEVSIEHLGDGVFAVAWVQEHERSADPEDGRRLTAVHAATLRAPGLVRSRRRLSGLGSSVEAATGEHRRPVVLRTGATEQVIAWFRCAYGSSPGGLACFDRDRLFLRDRVAGRPAGKILEIAGVAADSQVVFTGERLLTLSPIRRADDRYSLEVRGFVLE